MTYKFEKYFTPEEAKRTLPLVKKIVKDIIEHSYAIRSIADSLTTDPAENEEIKKLSVELNSFMKELEEIGCFYKDWSFSVGLVDFPALIEGEEVFLCWRSDEDDILFYHSLTDGFAGRKPIPAEYFAESPNH